MELTEVQRAVRAGLARLEAHNPSRRGHGERVASLSVAVGFELGLRDDRLVLLRAASALHDLHKTLLPSDLLEAPRPLAEVELASIRDAARDFEWPISDEITYWLRQQYHPQDERDVPLETKIIQLCTAFDCITSDQPWRTAKSEDEALKEIRSLSGRQFDAAVVEAFLRVQPLLQPIRDV